MKGNVIRLNIMHLNSVHLNSIGEVQSVSLTAGESTEDPVYPPTTYTLAANVSNGKVTATKNGTAISLPYVATEGDVIVLSVTPDEGYEFNGWLDGNKSNPRTVTMNADVALSAQCVEVVKKKAEFEVDSETMNLLADGDEDDEELSSLSFAIDSETMSLFMNNGGKVYDFAIDINGNLIAS